MRTRSRAWVGLVVLVLAGTACGASEEAAPVAAGAGGDAGTLATLAVIDTTVDVDGQEGDEGQGLAVGQVVSTTPTGFGEVNFFDGSITRVAQDATYTITELSDDAGERRVVSTLDGGTSWNRVDKLSGNEGEFSVRTPVATATATGTAFAVDCVDLPVSCAFTVVEGTVEVELPDGTTIVLGAGESITITANQAPPDPVTLSDRELEDDPWISRNLALDRDRGFDDAGPSGPGEGEELTATGVLEIDFDQSCLVVDSDEGRVELHLSDHIVSGEAVPSLTLDTTGTDGPPLAYSGNEVRATGTVMAVGGTGGFCDADLLLDIDDDGLENLSGIDLSVTGTLRMPDSCGSYYLETPDGDVELRNVAPDGATELDVYGDFTTEPPTLRAGDASVIDGPVLGADGDTVTVTGYGAVGDEAVDGFGCGPVIGIVSAPASGITR